jgi:tagaturonate epimerase
METEKIKTSKDSSDRNELFNMNINNRLQIYRDSINEFDGHLFFIAKEGVNKYLFITSTGKTNGLLGKFNGDIEKVTGSNGVSSIKKCPMNTANRKLIQEIFEFTKPVLTGLKNSFGFGDRIGLANAGHLRAVKFYNFTPVLAQQSIRELNRTNRTADEVMDAAVWAVFQEGVKSGFGADADHLKNEADIDLMLNAGYKMLTFDPSEYVDNNADIYSDEILKKNIVDFNWGHFATSFERIRENYIRQIKIDNDLTINPAETDLLRAIVKYGRALIHIKNLNNYLKTKYSEYDYEIEVSVDETESVTSVFEHFFISNELIRLGVNFISLAIRFVGAFEKGIDYRGDLNLFKAEYIKHLKVIKHFGTYKISLHSGSDKFSVYKVIGSLKDTVTHVKTAGTSYLEALKVIALKEPALFKEILDISRGLYEKEKKTYHVSADINNVRESKEYCDEELLKLFESDDARQILHVTFGKVLTERKSNGEYLFKSRIIKCLKENEETHYQILVDHFKKHLEPFN